MQPRRGYALIYALVSMTALLSVAALALEVARVQVVKTELSQAADAAARQGIKGLQDGTFVSRATWVASQNKADGAAVALAAADVEAGSWNATTKAFTAGGAQATAVRVTVRRTVQTPFMALIGVASRQVTARAVAKGKPIGYAMVGLDSISMNGNSASYASGGGGSTNRGHIASNGNITLGGSAYINGVAYAGSGHSTTGGTVTGGRNNLTAPLSYPDGDAGVYATTNSNSNVPATGWAFPGASTKNIDLGSGEVITLPGGTYYFQNVSMVGGSAMRFTGPATVYVYGTFEMYGQTETSANVPGNLRIIMANRPDGTAPGAVTLAGGAALYANIYAPRSAVSITGTADLYGSVLGKSIYMGGSGTVHYDLSLDSAHGTIALVE